MDMMTIALIVRQAVAAEAPAHCPTPPSSRTLIRSPSSATRKAVASGLRGLADVIPLRDRSGTTTARAVCAGRHAESRHGTCDAPDHRRAVGVSRMTVSNAFSRPDQLSATLRDRILAVAEELGYGGPDPAARALARGTAGTVGVLLSETLTYSLTDEVAMAFLAGISDELAPTGLSLTLLSARTQGRHRAGPRRRHRRSDRLLLQPGVLRGQLADAPSAAIGVRGPGPAPGITSINIDDRLGARAAAQHVIDLGHRQVAIVTTGFAGEFGFWPTRSARPPRTPSGSACSAGSTRSTAPASRPPSCASRTPNPDDVGYSRRRRPCSRSAERPPPSSASPTPSPAASSARSRTPDCRSRRTCRSSASTTTRSAVASPRHSRPCARMSTPRAEPRPPH